MWWYIIIGAVIGIIGLFAALLFYGQHIQKKQSIVELVATGAQLYIYLFASNVSSEIWDLSQLEERNIASMQLGLIKEEMPLVNSMLPILYCIPSVDIYYYPATQEFDFKVEEEYDGEIKYQ